MFNVGKMGIELTDLKCKDCCNFVLDDWSGYQKVCKLDGMPYLPNSPACISIELSARAKRESSTNKPKTL